MVRVNEMLNDVVVDNVVVINGVELPKLTDEETVKVMKYIDTLVKGRTNEEPSSVVPKVSTPVAKVTGITLAEEESTPQTVVIPGTKMWDEDFLTVTDVDGEYRLYINCPVAGEKGKKIRYAIKASAKEKGAKFGGNYDNNDFYWVFPTKKATTEYIKARKEFAKKSGN